MVWSVSGGVIPDIELLPNIGGAPAAWKGTRADAEAEEDEMDGADEPDLDAAIHQASSVPVPDWYQCLCFGGYSTLEVLDILRRIDNNMELSLLLSRILRGRRMWRMRQNQIEMKQALDIYLEHQ
ncbi:hypothetical protein QC764_0006770 [Podospora pseudoanserina]|uniref:Uncharacterized protein n=1 Tax=Podospora pseudoanserina TaxID=2609844 RepID=A0ABR0ILZ8_9PEZI|nr:hypothetical protein QC764_0006770 [Podospora pseudoanserina]